MKEVENYMKSLRKRYLKYELKMLSESGSLSDQEQSELVVDMAVIGFEFWERV